jgi:hypothetical protein
MSRHEKPTVIGIDLAKGADRGAVAIRLGTRMILSAGNGQPAVIDRAWINGLFAGRQGEREVLALVFETIALAHGATVVRKVDGRHPGWHSGSIDLRIERNGVGANVGFSNLHGGYHSLISWYNEHGPGPWHTRNFSGPFCGAVREYSGRPHHKATTCSADWYGLAMALDAGLCLANRGEAFEPSAP